MLFSARGFFVVNPLALGHNRTGLMSEKPIYKRILLKLSGEALMGEQGYGIDPATITRIAQEVNDVHTSA